MFRQDDVIHISSFGGNTRNSHKCGWWETGAAKNHSSVDSIIEKSKRVGYQISSYSYGKLIETLVITNSNQYSLA